LGDPAGFIIDAVERFFFGFVNLLVKRGTLGGAVGSDQQPQKEDTRNPVVAMILLGCTARGPPPR
jgi:hypothetical protein